MAGKLEGKVAFITGAARGQGRSHAIRLAQEGANIIAVDICQQIDTVPYPMATPGDLAETVKEVEALDRRIVATRADVRDEAGLKAAFDAGVAELGPVDIVLANAGIAPMSLHETHDAWQDVINVNLTGVFNTVETAIPSMIERGQGGAIVLTSSTAGINGIGGPTRGGLGYTAAKHGVVGLMRSYANNLAPHSIRVNTVHPTGVATPMVLNEPMQAWIQENAAAAATAPSCCPVSTQGASGIGCRPAASSTAAAAPRLSVDWAALKAARKGACLPVTTAASIVTQRTSAAMGNPQYRSAAKQNVSEVAPESGTDFPGVTIGRSSPMSASAAMTQNSGWPRSSRIPGRDSRGTTAMSSASPAIVTAVM